jgi:TPR repeat protein
MNRTLLCLALILAANGARAQVPHKKACDFLTQADISAVLGVAVGPPGDPRNTGKTCQYSPQRPNFSLNVDYSDVPDPGAVANFQKIVDTNSFETATPVPNVGDAAFFRHLGTVTAATKGDIVVFVGGTMTLVLSVGTLDQLRALAQKALGGSGATGFAYNAGSAVPVSAKPATPSAASTSPFDQLKADLAKKAERNASAARALADLYRYGNRGNDGVTKPDYAAAMYWYKSASDRGVARASYELAMIYHEGTAGRVNDEAAKELLTKAADAGFVPAMFPLALLYAEKRDAVGQRRAIGWATKAAQGNDPQGHLLMGVLWEQGQLSFDDRESGRNALAEYTKSAEQGNCFGMLNIGGLYFNGGHGLTQSASQAEAWFARAETCFGRQFENMQAQAARYRSLAAAGHLPVPPPPPAPISGSRFLKRKSPSQAPEFSEGVRDIVAGIVVMTVLAAAYAEAHPEEASSPTSSGVDPATIVITPLDYTLNCTFSGRSVDSHGTCW